MGLFAKIQRHAAMAGGDFATIFKGVEIPPLPEAAARLVAEINQPRPDVGRLVKVISSEPEIAAKVLRTINSSLFALRNPVASVQHAVVLLGFRQIRALALSYAVVDSVPVPKNTLFDHAAFWTDSVLKATLARSFAARNHKGLEDDAFTAALLSDVAIPVLLSSWHDYYEPIVEAWRTGGQRLSEIEREQLKWDHAQAGAWVLQSWEFPEETVCFVGLHTRPLEMLKDLGLEGSVGLPVLIASHAPSVLHRDPARASRFVEGAAEALSMNTFELLELFNGVRDGLAEVLQLFSIENEAAFAVLDDLVAATDPDGITTSDASRECA